MILIIDGYNVMWAWYHTPHQLKKNKKNFIEHLVNYRQKTGNDVILVFDAGPCTYSTREKEKGITIIYSGTNAIADDCIKDYIRENPQAEIVMVSSDRELREFAAERAIPHMGAQAFKTLIESKMQKPDKKREKNGVLRKTAATNDPELDALMYQVDLQVQKQEDEPIVRKSPSKRVSKQERKILKKIKKL